MKVISLFTTLACLSLNAQEAPNELAWDAHKHIMMRSDTLPQNSIENATDAFLEGYIQALIDCHYSEYCVIVKVEDNRILLSNLPKNELFAQSIVNFVKDIPGCRDVEIAELTPEEEKAREIYGEAPTVDGIWFPQSTILFAPLIADPRQPTYSVVPRFSDGVVGNQAISVSYGDEFPFFRWKNVFRWRGDMQIGIVAGVWAVFNFEEHAVGEFSEMFNADYMVGVPLAYAVDKWSWRARVYHISSHLGDEFLVNNSEYIAMRKNPSFEALDLFVSYQFSEAFRAYGGFGYIFHSDNGFKLDELYVQYGTEVRAFGTKSCYHMLYGTPFLAIHIANWQYHNWDFDISMKLGYEWSKMQGVGRKMRLFVGYHHGFSAEGQFSKLRAEYYEMGFSWGF